MYGEMAGESSQRSVLQSSIWTYTPVCVYVAAPLKKSL